MMREARRVRRDKEGMLWEEWIFWQRGCVRVRSWEDLLLLCCSCSLFGLVRGTTGREKSCGITLRITEFGKKGIRVAGRS